MIELNIQDYCQGCPMFNARTDKVYVNSKVLNTYITCENKDLCERIKTYLEEKQDEEH